MGPWNRLFNGILTGIGLAFYIQLHWSPVLVVYIIVAGILSIIAFMAHVNFWGALWYCSR